MWLLMNQEVFPCLSKDVPEFLLQEGIFDFEVSVEGTLLYILDQAVKNGGERLKLLYYYSWFPKGLKGVGQQKR